MTCTRSRVKQSVIMSQLCNLISLPSIFCIQSPPASAKGISDLIGFIYFWTRLFSSERRLCASHVYIENLSQKQQEKPAVWNWKPSDLGGNPASECHGFMYPTQYLAKTLDKSDVWWAWKRRLASVPKAWWIRDPPGWEGINASRALAEETLKTVKSLRSTGNWNPIFTGTKTVCRSVILHPGQSTRHQELSIDDAPREVHHFQVFQSKATW